MKTKFYLALSVIVIALIAAACAPDVVNDSSPTVEAVQPVDNETSALVPVTGKRAVDDARAPQETRLWSGEILFSDNNNPDHVQNVQPATNQIQPEASCMSEDSLPRRQSGCIE